MADAECTAVVWVKNFLVPTPQKFKLFKPFKLFTQLEPSSVSDESEGEHRSSTSRMSAVDYQLKALTV